MPFSFSTALSGLNANSNAISVSGNNIANANTTGFRAGSITFADVYASAQGLRLNGAGSPLQVGGGVRTAATHANFAQGTLNDSTSLTSAAIEGNGFFVVRNSTGVQSYTRAGDFVLDTQGHLVTPGGQLVQGYPAVNGVVGSSGTLTTLQIPVGQTLPPIVTTEGTFRANLDSLAPTGSEFHTAMQVYDSRGTSRTLDLNFVKLASGGYSMTASLDGVAAQTSVNGGAPGATPVSVTFDASGQLTAPTALAIVPDQAPLGGAALPSINIVLRETNPDGSPGAFNLTSFSAASGVSYTAQDGSAPGTYSSLLLGEGGVLLAAFSNGQARPVGQYALATFTAQDGLARAGNNLFSETNTSGQPSIGTPESSGRGRVVGSVLEASNVDIASEFVELIKAQRGFQANSRVISAMNEALQQVFQAI